jgi:hypothetical protein
VEAVLQNVQKSYCSIPGKKIINGLFLFTTASRPSMKWVPGALILGVKCQGRETDHTPLLVTRLRMRIAILPYLRTPSRRGA